MNTLSQNITIAQKVLDNIAINNLFEITYSNNQKEQVFCKGMKMNQIPTQSGIEFVFELELYTDDINDSYPVNISNVKDIN